MFPWLYHIPPSLHGPCSLAFLSAHLKKQSPFPVFTDWLRQGKVYTRQLGQRVCTVQLSGTLDRLPGDVHGCGLMLESRVFLSLSPVKELMGQGDLSQCCSVTCWEESGTFLFTLSNRSFLISVLHHADEPSHLDSRYLIKEFASWTVVKLVLLWERRAGTSYPAIFLMSISFIICSFVSHLRNHCLTKIVNICSYVLF